MHGMDKRDYKMTRTAIKVVPIIKMYLKKVYYMNNIFKKIVGAIVTGH